MYAFKTANGSVFTLVLLFALAATSAFSSAVEDNGQSKSSVHHNHVSPKSSSPSPGISVSQAREVHLLERTLPNGGPIQTTNAHGWEIRYRQYFSFIIPVQVAASVLEEFYTSCLRRIARNQFRNRPAPGNAFTFTMGSVLLAFRAADPDQGLTWSAYEMIIDNLLANARTGFTAPFKAEWYHPDSNKLVYVSLSMLQRIGLGRVQD